MLSEHSLIFPGETPNRSLNRCLFSRYQDFLYTLRHFTDGEFYNRLVKTCSIEPVVLREMLERADKIGHVKYEKREKCKITEGGIEYNIFWFAVQDRFNIRSIVPSKFKIYDMPYNEEAIKLLMANISNGNSQKNSCYKAHRRSNLRDSLTKYLDILRYLKKQKDGNSIYNLVNKTSIPYDKLKPLKKHALSIGHIEFDKEKKSKKGDPFIKIGEEGLHLLNAVNWLVTKCDLEDYVPSQVG